MNLTLSPSFRLAPEFSVVERSPQEWLLQE